MDPFHRGSRYEILEALGEGGTGRVYRARDRLDGRTVALKVLEPGEAPAGGSGAAPLLARSEFRLLASQSHPGIVRVLDYGSTPGGRPFFAMELLEGRDLAAFARETAARPEALAASPEFLDVVRQVLEALDYVHRRGVLHLDLKPSNILVTRDEEGRPVAKLIDFGFARVHTAERVGTEGAVEASLAPPVSGTAEYLAPERIRGEAPGARSDLYSLGAVLFEALTGQCPFRGATPGDLIRAHLETAPDGAALPERFRGLVLRLLEKQPSRRPASARAAIQELFGEPEPGAAVLPPFEAAFVGREEILRRLEAAAGFASAGRPRAVLLRGATGAGKTRLLRELEVRLQLAGVCAGVEACREGAARPGGLLARLLQRAAGGDEGAVEGLLAELEVLGSEAGAPDRAEPADLEGRRESLIHRVTAKIAALASEKPVALLVDDAHLADTLSRDGLIALLRAIEHGGASQNGGAANDDRPGARLCIVLAGRSQEADAPALVEIERSARGFSSCEGVELGGLSEADVERYLAQVLGHGAFPPDLARTLGVETGGNVLFIEEYLKLLVRSGRLRSRGAAWEVALGEKLDVPRTVEEAISRRIARVEGKARDAIEWAAVRGAPLSAEEVAAYLGEACTALEADRLLSGLVLEQLLAREGTRYSFAHAAAREVVRGALPEAERRRRHGAVASRLLLGGGEVEEIAEHLYLSPEPRRAREYLLRAGERARRTGALREAALHYTRALAVAEDDAERFEALLHRQEALGHLGRKEAQEEDIEALKRIAAAIGDPRREREAILREALYLESLGRKREALERLESAIARCGGDPDAEARLRSRAALLRLYLSEFDAGFETLGRALEHARRRGDRGLEAECRQIAGLGHYLRASYDLALEEMGTALAIRREDGEEQRAAALESNLGLIHFDRGDLEAAEERFLASLKLFRRAGLRRGEAVNLLNLGLVYLEMGRHERALDALHGSLRIRRELGDRRGEGADLGNLAAAWMQVGRFERAVPLIEEALRIARELENRQSESANECRLGQIDLERGEPRRALERLERGLEIARRAGLAAQEVLARMDLARARLALGEAAAAREEAEAALKLAAAGKMRRRISSAQANLAAALLAEGRAAEADRASREAVEELEKRPGPSSDGHAIWFQRCRVLEAASGEGAGEEALRKAYVLLREKSDAFQDEELRQGYLENVPLHRELNRLHEALQARNRREASRRERSFHEIAKSIHAITEIDPLLDRLLSLAIETTHAEKGLIALKTQGGDFTIRAARGMARESVDDAAEICRSVIADVARGGEPVLAADAGSDDRFRERRSIISFRIRTLMCVPMTVRDEIIGAVYVDGRGASSFNREDLEYLVSFAQLAAIAVENARLLERLRAENLYLRREVETRYRFENLIGQSPAMERLSRLMEKVANTPASILICGETGTGKEVIARSIHYASDRRSKPFITVDCGALPENLLESELFGHRRGAFSGAIHDRVGLFEEAEGGTIFLDEVTNTSLDLQAKLLRVIQEGEIRRVGENPVRKVDVRIVAATNVDMRAAVEKGTFREDLFYRLNVIPIEVPPLRERPEDIPILALHFLKRSCGRHAKQIAGFTEEGMGFLARAPWRGNVRELENLIEKAVILAEGDRLDAAFLESLLPPAARPPREGAGPAEGRKVVASAAPVPGEAGPAAASAPAGSPGSPASSRAPGSPGAILALTGISLEDFDRRWLDAERDFLTRIVEESRGNLAEAARRARVRNRNTLISRLRRHGIHGKKKE